MALIRPIGSAHFIGHGGNLDTERHSRADGNPVVFDLKYSELSSAKGSPLLKSLDL